MIKYTEYRIYPDGEVVHQDDFAERDSDPQAYDDYSVHTVPDSIIDHILGCK